MWRAGGNRAVTIDGCCTFGCGAPLRQATRDRVNLSRFARHGQESQHPTAPNAFFPQGMVSFVWRSSIYGVAEEVGGLRGGGEGDGVVVVVRCWRS